MKKNLLLSALALLGLAACSTESAMYASMDGAYDRMAPFSYGDAPGQGRPGGQAGVLTAGEWNDLDHWGFWSGLMTSESYQGMSSYWRMWTSRRVAVRVADPSGKRLPSVPVLLRQGQQDLWETRTDNQGEASLWIDPFHADASTEGLTLLIDGIPQEGSPKTSPWNVQEEEVEVNYYVLDKASTARKSADIAFIVDATGSMGDEIEFLQKDLTNILVRVKNGQGEISLRTGTVFYRDEGDDYVTKSSPFTDDYKKTIEYITLQHAGGGGDLPEAVHSALATGILDLQWDLSARSRIAVLILDAPAHQDHQGVVESLQKSIRLYARSGIKLIPVFCSSPSKECEFMCRYFSILTGGTYVFLTDDSGVGADHIEPSVGTFQVEQLNDLLVRLIAKYIG